MYARLSVLLDKCGRVLLFIFGALLLPIAFFLLLAQAPVRAQANVLFVDSAATGDDDGSSWADAYVTLQDALADASGGNVDEIWVAAGVYYPDEGIGQIPDVPTSNFRLLDDVALYGGFAGTETLRSERDWQSNVTVLSGDIDGNDTIYGDGVMLDATTDLVGDNAYHVVTGSGVTTTALLDGFTITGGDTVDGDTIPGDGGMYNDGSSPSLANLTFSGNRATFGGGMLNVADSNPTLTNVTFSGNLGLAGGGMGNLLSNPTLTDVTFSDNFALGGGGLFNIESNSILTNTTFVANEAVEGAGGIFNEGGVLMLVGSRVITNSTIITSGTETGDGGGIWNNGILHIANIQVEGNVTGNGNDSDDGKGGDGGGIYESPASRTTYLYNATITTNRADANEDGIGDGGGLFNAGTAFLYNSILAENSDSPLQSVHPDCSLDDSFGATFEAAQYNVIGNDSGCDGVFDDEPGNDVEGNLVGVAPELAALGDYGGPTPTRALYPTSPARDAGDPAGCIDHNGDPLSADQHGEPRPEGAGGRCDIGAVEYTLPGAA